MQNSFGYQSNVVASHQPISYMSDDNWEYLPVLNSCIKILFTISLGTVLGKWGVFDKYFVAHATKFVFHVALPCLVVKGIGVGIDFYADSNIWRFVAAFLTLRLVTLVAAFGSMFLHLDRTCVDIGDIAVRWLCLSWISTVILGIPILTAVLNDPGKGNRYGILAAFSSFIFQLPLQLLFLECYAVEKQSSSTEPHVDDKRDESGSLTHAPNTSEAVERQGVDITVAAEEGDIMSEALQANLESNVAAKHVPQNRWALFLSLSISKHMWKKIGLRLLHNPVLWGIIFGFLISLSTFGVTFLRPVMESGEANEDYVEGLQWLVDSLEWLGATVSPLSLFAMGLWMQKQGRRLFNIGMIQVSLFMLSKLFFVPLLMVGLAYAFDLNESDDEPARAAVLIAVLPISMASFSLGKTYNAGEDVLSANVVVGTLLMLPSLLIWNMSMDKLGLFDNFAVKGN